MARPLLGVQPEEGISLRFGAKVPSAGLRLRNVSMDFTYMSSFLVETPEAYERLLLDCMIGDPTLFTRADEVFEAWSFIGSLQTAWASLPPPVFPNYAPYSDGPAEAAKLFTDSPIGWRPIRAPEAGDS